VFTFIEHRPDVPDAVDAWLDGYRRVFPLASGSEDVIPDLLMLRRLQVLAWLAWHAETPLAQAASADYTGRTLELADRYLHEEPA
jgi:Ser/Thr protein kinase RdoA (MazF antagonist)